MKFMEILSDPPSPTSPPCPVQAHGNPPKDGSSDTQQQQSCGHKGKRKGLRTSQQQHSPTHKPQSITQPSPALPPPPATPQNVLQTHSKHFFTPKPCITQTHSSLPKCRWLRPPRWAPEKLQVVLNQAQSACSLLRISPFSFQTRPLSLAPQP